ncbi:MAG: TVP38/TMEM64 family protein [Ezakiella sp.]|nr:TVP38/TMEM64 family protein [Ezakiella sp.]MDD7472214.1 TVP38/TMEM64 family protein [Bacillota bacterium]MDY3923207.1 TVP38/TMEM64 family protein [Ezakiella sp.]
MKKANIKRIVLLGVILVLVLIYLFVPSVNSGIKNATKVLGTLDIEEVVEYIRGFGVKAMAVSFFLMILQSIIAPIPAFVITLSNAMIWGWWKGAILSWTSSMVGAALCFYIARVLGRDVVAKIATEGVLNSMEKFFDRYGKYTILVCRLLPFVPFDPISYAAGLTSMSFGSFFLATGLGQLPATVIYSYFGGQLTGGAKAAMYGLFGLFSVSIIVYVAKKVYNDKKMKKDAN